MEKADINDEVKKIDEQIANLVEQKRLLCKTHYESIFSKVKDKPFLTRDGYSTRIFIPKVQDESYAKGLEIEIWFYQDRIVKLTFNQNRYKLDMEILKPDWDNYLEKAKDYIKSNLE